MKNKPTPLKELKDFCEKHGIYVPSGAPRSAYEAAMVRAAINGREAKPDAQIGCFGHLDPVDGNCLACLYKEDCGEATFGMPKYMARLDREANQRRFKVSCKPVIKVPKKPKKTKSESI